MNTDPAIHLRLQLAAAIQDCIKSLEETPDEYMWGEDRAQMYVDVADMSLAVAESWEKHGVEGIIYEISEAIVTACEQIPGPLDADQIDEIVLKTWRDHQHIGFCNFDENLRCTVCGKTFPGYDSVGDV